MISISNSEIQLFKTCRRSWYLQYYLQRQPKKQQATGATNLGTKVHAALEAYYGMRYDPRQVKALLADMYDLDTHDFPAQAEQLSEEYVLAEAMISGYFEWLAETGADEGLEVVGVEREIIVPVEDLKVNLRGRLDMTVTDKHSGALLFLDHKTCIQWLDKDYLDRDEQSKFYMMLQRLENPRGGNWCDGGIFNMLRKVKRGPKAKPPFYKRETVRHNRDSLNSMYQRTYQVCAEILELRDRLDAQEPFAQVAYPHPSKDCSWRCPAAAGLCSMMDDGSDWTGYINDKWEPVNPYARYTEASYLDRLDQEGLL